MVSCCGSKKRPSESDIKTKNESKNNKNKNKIQSNETDKENKQEKESRLDLNAKENENILQKANLFHNQSTPNEERGLEDAHGTAQNGQQKKFNEKLNETPIIAKYYTTVLLEDDEYWSNLKENMRKEFDQLCREWDSNDKHTVYKQLLLSV
jgi:hypothetical protein